jgi:hypothetical protein
MFMKMLSREAIGIAGNVTIENRWVRAHVAKSRCGAVDRGKHHWPGGSFFAFNNRSIDGMQESVKALFSNLITDAVSVRDRYTASRVELQLGLRVFEAQGVLE